jgi:hypothetical protein
MNFPSFLAPSGPPLSLLVRVLLGVCSLYQSSEPVVVRIGACEQQLRGASSSLTACPRPVHMLSVHALFFLNGYVPYVLWMHGSMGEEIQPVHQSTHTGN